EASFTAFSLPFVLSQLGQTDTLVCVVPSLAAAAASAFAARARGLRLVLWVQDLVLLAAATVGGVERARRLIGAASGVEAAAARAADRVIVCSPGFRRYLVERGVPDERVAVVHNWVDVDWIARANGRPHGKPLRF